MSTPQGFLDINNQVDTPPDAVDEPGVNDVLTSVRPQVSSNPFTVVMGSTPVNPGTSVKLLDADPSRTRALVGISANVTGVTVTTLAYLSDRVLDGSVGGLRYMQAAQIPVINSGSDYLEIRATSDLWVSVPSSAANPVYVSFVAESFAH